MKIWIIMFTFCFVALAGSPNWARAGEKPGNDLKSSLRLLADHRVVFGHHSVGENILEGVRDLAKLHEVILAIEKIDTEESRLPQGGGFLHFWPGKNRDPRSKIDAFVRMFQKRGAQLCPDVAFMKFCYIDFTPATDVNALFAYYKKQMELLQQQFPETRFLHCTVPLTVRSKKAKNRMRRAIGQLPWGDACNRVREQFNELLRSTMDPNLVFDLARVESTRSDGTREGFPYKGGQIYFMVREYSHDGGHLNSTGRQWVAGKLVLFLADLLRKTDQKP